MLDEIYLAQEEKNEKAIEALKKDFTTIRTGKVQVSILDHVKVDYYGAQTALNQVATVLATDATTISVSPWEKNILKDIEKAIQEANIGVNPNNNGESIQLFFPPMTVDQRELSAKEAKAMGENAKVSIRNVRKDANNKIKNLEKDKEITSDESKDAQDDVQKSTDDAINLVDKMVKEKQDEVLKV
jgi:ribosome recycling factor